MKDYKVVGKSVERTDARVKVTGSARYAGDLVAPGMLHGKILRSPVAHANILNIDDEQGPRPAGCYGRHNGKGLSGHPFWHPAGHTRPASYADHEGPPLRGRRGRSSSNR